MSWIKILFINTLVFFSLVIILEIGAGFGRQFIGKNFLFPYIIDYSKYTFLGDPCNEMQTDVLLSHVPKQPNECQPLGGKTSGEYVTYDVAKADLPILLTLGGSTTSGFYQEISDGQTYPKLLADKAKEEFNVVNGGVGAYSSLQELFKLTRDGPRFKNLAIIISLNGINELPNYHGPEQIRKSNYPFLTNIQFGMNTSQNWIDQRFFRGVEASDWMLYLPNLRTLYVYFNNKNYTELKKIHKGDHIGQDKSKLAFIPLAPAKRWEVNVKRMHAISKLMSAQYFVFLQPTIGLPGPQSRPLKNSSDEVILNLLANKKIDEMSVLYKELKEICNSLTFCFDISNNIPPTGDVYNDPRHHNAKGNEQLASLIWEKIKIALDLSQ